MKKNKSFTNQKSKRTKKRRKKKRKMKKIEKEYMFDESNITDKRFNKHEGYRT